MPKVFPNDHFKVIVAGRNTESGDYWELGFHYIASGEPEGTALNMAGELAINWADNRAVPLATILASNVHIDSVSAKCIGEHGGPLVTTLVDFTGAKTPCETIGNGAQIIWYGDTDPVLEGRTYIPGIPNDSFDAGAWDAAYSTDVVAFITSMLAPFPFGTGMAATFTLVSYQIGVDSQTAADGLLRRIPGTQRRRLRR